MHVRHVKRGATVQVDVLRFAKHVFGSFPRVSARLLVQRSMSPRAVNTLTHGNSYLGNPC